MKKTAVVYSSLTGNTKKVGEAIFEVIDHEKKIFSIEEALKENFDTYDRIIIGFWVDKGSLDARAKKLLKKIKDKEVAFFGTLGAEPDSEHGKKVFAKVQTKFSKENNCIGGFLCLGEVAPKLIAMMGKFPLNIVHPLTEERKIRLAKANNHPDEKDLEDAKNYFRNI
ncbi:MAG: flavodoxin family protein [Fusobacteriaceae bacterium]